MRNPGPDRLLFALALPILICAGGGTVLAGPWSGQSSIEDGVEIVRNPARPIEDGVQVLVAEEAWRVGGDADGPGDFFGVVSTVLRDEQGYTYLLDTQLSELKIFGPEGDFLHQLGRPGEAPGEFGQAWQMFLLPPDRVGVIQTMPGRVVVFGRDGMVYDDLRLPEYEGMGFVVVTGAESNGGNLVMEVNRSSFAKEGITTLTELVSVDPEGAILATYAQREDFRRMDRVLVKDEDSFSGQWHVDDQGRVWIAPWFDRYRLECYRADGQLERVLEREFELRPRTDEDLADRKTHVSVSGPSKIEFEYDLSPTDRAIGTFVLRPDGEIWVVNSHGAREMKQEGCAGAYDVFDAEGRFLRQVELRAEYDHEEDSARLVGDSLFVIRGISGASRSLAQSFGVQIGEDPEDEGEFDPTPLEIVCHRLVPSASPVEGR